MQGGQGLARLRRARGRTHRVKFRNQIAFDSIEVLGPRCKKVREACESSLMASAQHIPG